MFQIHNPLNPASPLNPNSPLNLANTVRRTAPGGATAGRVDPKEAAIRKQLAEAEARDRRAIQEILGNLAGEKKGSNPSGGLIGGLNSAFSNDGTKVSPQGKKEAAASSESAKSGDGAAGAAQSPKRER